ncbi:MAG: TonB-dependent receptor plug domain-containing protein [Bacteroidota bacterium]
MRISTFILLSCLIALSSCKVREGKSAAKTDKSAENATLVREPNQVIDLTSHLKQVPGLYVSGQGPNASIRIRGNASLKTSGSPLFVLNGNQMSSYQMVYSMVHPAQIRSVQVLKNPSDISYYGVRGANGVIVIRLKK